MKFHFLSINGDGLPLCLRLYGEGNEVSIFIKDESARKTLYEGIDAIKKTNSPFDGIDKETYIVVDTVGLGDMADRLKKQGYKVFGGGVFNDRLELDRKFGQQMMKAVGINTPKSITFTSFDDAIAAVIKDESLLVFKPHNNAMFTYVAKNKSDMINYLNWIKTNKMIFDLQEFIDGIEVSTEGFFNGEKFLSPINSTMEEKKFMSANIGPQVGCAGSLVWAYDSEKPKLFYSGLAKMEKILKLQKYIGPIDLNTIISRKDGKIYGLEFTSRFGYDAIFAFLELMQQDLGKLIADCCDGNDVEILCDKQNYGISVRLSIPPYPANKVVSNDILKKVNMSVYGKPVIEIEPSLGSVNSLWFIDIFIKDGVILCAGNDGIIGEVSGKAKLVSDARKNVYQLIEKLTFCSDIQYNIDIGKRAVRDLQKLKELYFFPKRREV